jgi:uncharacterized repeat protein (TIGR03837 family)
MRFDIFCSVVDHYGDVGVSWRLAKRLAQTHFSNSDHFTTTSKDQLRLFCDRIDLVEQIAGEEGLREAISLGVEILPWESANHAVTAEYFPDVVIETFSCALPLAYTELLKDYAQALIINVEYLSAEEWTVGAHGLASTPSQAGDLSRYFYYPGFTEKSGGLLQGKLPELMEGHIRVPRSLEPVWKFLRPDTESKKICLFNYGGGKTQRLLQEMMDSKLPLDILICGELSLTSASKWLEEPFNEPLRRNFLQCIPMPFIPQDDFDWVLNACDFNIVRGEDSFVRAQWAGKPFIWDIYPQDDGAHVKKLEAFLEIYLKDASPVAKTACQNAMLGQAVSSWWPHLRPLNNHAMMWRQELIKSQEHGDLAIRLREFVFSKQKSS